MTRIPRVFFLIPFGLFCWVCYVMEEYRNEKPPARVAAQAKTEKRKTLEEEKKDNRKFNSFLLAIGFGVVGGFVTIFGKARAFYAEKWNDLCMIIGPSFGCIAILLIMLNR